MSVRHALLALLSEGPKYGLQLREEFEANTGQVWPLNGGQVYTTPGEWPATLRGGIGGARSGFPLSLSVTRVHRSAASVGHVRTGSPGMAGCVSGTGPRRLRCQS